MHNNGSHYNILYLDIKYSGYIFSHNLFLSPQPLFPSSPQTTFLILHILFFGGSLHDCVCVACMCICVLRCVHMCEHSMEKDVGFLLSSLLSLHVKLVIVWLDQPASKHRILCFCPLLVLELGLWDNTQLTRGCGSELCPQACAASTLIHSIISSTSHSL